MIRLLALVVISMVANVDVIASPYFGDSQPLVQPSDEPWNPQEMLSTIQTYIAWGSPEGKPMPDCKAFDSAFFGNKTWRSPFVVPGGFVIFEIEKYCNGLAENLTWHSGRLEAGNFVYPLYYGLRDPRPYKVAFVWAAVGESVSYRDVLGLKRYNFTIISTMQFYNETAIFIGEDIFWPESNGEVPDVLMTMINQYMSFTDGDCNKFPEIFQDKYGLIQPSGSDDVFGTAEIVRYCDEMRYKWTSYTYRLHDVTFSVSTYNGLVDNVAFTWTRTGVYLDEVRTDEIMTELNIYQDDTPLKDLRIGSAYDFFQPPPGPPIAK